VSGIAKRCLPFGLVVAASVWISFTAGGLGDYPVDAGPALHALSHGHVSAFLSLHPDMGPLSILLRAPFAGLGGDDPFAVYRWGALPCVLAAGLLGLYLAGIARRRGAGLPCQVVLAGVCLLNPLTFAALELGHPEELLTAALAVGAVAVASQGHRGRAALLLGLAIASKQWALLAALPVLMALPAGRVRVGLGAAGIVAALILPTFLADPQSFLDTQHNLALESGYAGQWSIWFPLADSSSNYVPALGVTGHTYYAPDLVARWSHPWIILLGVVVPLGLARRRHSLRLSGADAMALLALLALARCLLDPVDNLYYHAPLLLALAGWDAFDPRGLPLRALAATSLVLLLKAWDASTLSPQDFNLIYIAVAAAAAAAIVASLFRRPGRAVRRSPAGAAVAPHRA
jgi:hypothetical protein